MMGPVLDAFKACDEYLTQRCYSVNALTFALASVANKQGPVFSTGPCSCNADSVPFVPS